jgi:iron transport multicopper oxidase
MTKLPHPLLWVAIVLGFSTYCSAKTVTYDFNVTWVTANPDGLKERKVIGVNNQWPLPVIEVEKGDQLVVNMHNGLGDKNASIHFHGMYQNGTNEMDGPIMVTQCPIPPGADFTYNFTVNQNGTYWYHCHADYCYPDGYRQAFIVHDSESYFADQYEEEFTVTVSDWYHELVEGIAPDFLSVYNPTGAEPIPQAFLFNDTLKTNLTVKPNTTYLIRLINIGAFVAQYFYIEGHNFTIVEIDGIYTEPTEADTLYIAIAQRYAILLTTKNSTDTNYPIVTVADSALLDGIPSDLQLNQTNWLQYNADAPHPQAEMTVDVASDLNPFDDITLIPYDHMPLLPEPDYTIELSVNMENLANGAGYALLNNISYTAPKIPTIFSVLSSGSLASNSLVYGEFTHPLVLNHNDVVQVILNNNDGGSHPFHLHGHAFQVIDRAPSYGSSFYSYADGSPVPYDASNHTAFPPYPARRDTFVLPPQGYFVIRFVADNPGVWMFHCHIDWHLSQGLGLLFIEAPTQMQERLHIPQDHLDVCKAGGIPTVGNAAANSEDFLDLEGQNAQVGWLPAGFTTRGVVALVFSCVSAVLGVAFLVVYGLSDLKFKEEGVRGDSGVAGAGKGKGAETTVTEAEREVSNEIQ